MIKRKYQLIGLGSIAGQPEMKWPETENEPVRVLMMFNEKDARRRGKKKVWIFITRFFYNRKDIGSSEHFPYRRSNCKKNFFLASCSHSRRFPSMTYISSFSSEFLLILFAGGCTDQPQPCLLKGKHWTVEHTEVKGENVGFVTNKCRKLAHSRTG